MAKVILAKLNTASTKKPVYKFKNGKLIETFASVASAAYKVGVSESALYTYIRGKTLKPVKIPKDEDYSYSQSGPL